MTKGDKLIAYLTKRAGKPTTIEMFAKAIDCTIHQTQTAFTILKRAGRIDYPSRKPAEARIVGDGSSDSATPTKATAPRAAARTGRAPKRTIEDVATEKIATPAPKPAEAVCLVLEPADLTNISNAFAVLGEVLARAHTAPTMRVALVDIVAKLTGTSAYMAPEQPAVAPPAPSPSGPSARRPRAARAHRASPAATAAADEDEEPAPVAEPKPKPVVTRFYGPEGNRRPLSGGVAARPPAPPWGRPTVAEPAAASEGFRVEDRQGNELGTHPTMDEAMRFMKKPDAFRCVIVKTGTVLQQKSPPVADVVDDDAEEEDDDAPLVRGRTDEEKDEDEESMQDEEASSF